jgi:hypothetical protein
MSQAPHTLLFLLLQVFQAPYQEARTPYNKYFRPQPLLSHNLLSDLHKAQGSTAASRELSSMQGYTHLLLLL